MASSPSHPSAPPGLQHSYGPEMAGPDHLQNSFGPEVAASEYHMGYGPQAVAVGGLDAAAVPGQQQQVAASPALGYSTYAEQAEKNNEYSGGGGEGAAAGPVTPRKRILGLPLWGFWLLVALAIVVLALAFGVGLGVGLSQQSSSSGSDSASAVTSSSSSSSTTTPVSATTATPTSSTASTTKTSSTSSSTSAAATSVRVEICQNAYLDSCTTITVPASSCSTCFKTPPPQSGDEVE